MAKWIGAAIMATTMMLGDVATRSSAAAAPADAALQKPQAMRSDVSAHRHHSRRAYYPYRPSYYGRPTYYSPSPFFLPIPPLWGYGWEWW
jgi:hypothetical protein